MSQRKEVQFYGILDGLISLGNVARDLCIYLSEHIEQLSVCHYRVPQHPDWAEFPTPQYSTSAKKSGTYFEPRLKAIRGCNSSANIGIFCGIPDVGGELLKSHKVKVIYTVCETNRIPSSWAEACNQLNCVFVPSAFCKQAYIDSGVTCPVEIMNYAAEQEYILSSGPQTSNPFIFFNTFNALSSLERKSLDELIRCFLKAFPDSPEIRLRIRTNACKSVTSLLGHYAHWKGFDRVDLDPLVYSTTHEYASIYSQVHCTVHPSKGEGFGLVPFHSILCGTPVISSGKTGLAEYVSSDNAMILNMGPEVHGDSWGNQPGVYYSVDEDELIEMMRYAYTHYDQERAKVRAASDLLRKRFDRSLTYKPLRSFIENSE